MRHTVHMKPSEVQFTVIEGQTILAAALNQNIAWPSRCRIGACGTCLCKILQGDVSYQIEPMLTERERSEGWALGCLAIPQSDIVLTFEE
ncbi:MAG: 2Fe-2S iron-sulfur cluster-binding protein [Vibrio sp.]